MDHLLKLLFPSLALPQPRAAVVLAAAAAAAAAVLAAAAAAAVECIIRAHPAHRCPTGSGN